MSVDEEMKRFVLVILSRCDREVHCGRADPVETNLSSMSVYTFQDDPKHKINP